MEQEQSQQSTKQVFPHAILRSESHFSYVVHDRLESVGRPPHQKFMPVIKAAHVRTPMENGDEAL